MGQNNVVVYLPLWLRGWRPPLCGSDGKLSAYKAGDMGLITGSGRFPGEKKGYPLQYSCLENSMDRGAWWTTVYGITEWDITEWITLSLFKRGKWFIFIFMSIMCKVLFPLLLILSWWSLRKLIIPFYLPTWFRVNWETDAAIKKIKRILPLLLRKLLDSMTYIPLNNSFLNAISYNEWIFPTFSRVGK